MASPEWWFSGSGENMLKGVENDPDNYPLLTDDQILDFLEHIPQARHSFDRLLPTMLPDEQVRLNALVEGAPTLTPLVWDTIADNFQHRLNTQHIRRGGEWAPPPFREGG